MIRRQEKDVIYFRFMAFGDYHGLGHGFFSRYGGISTGPFEELNCGGGVNDDPAVVEKNRCLALSILGKGRMVFVNQVHGDDILKIKEPFAHGSDIIETGVSADAMITNLPGIFLAMTVADCQAVLFFDPKKRVVAATHSGWRSSLKNIVGKTVRAMRDDFKCRPQDILACVGPSLGPCCSEFINFETEIPKKFWSYLVDGNHVDFRALTRNQLVFSGVPSDNIFISDICTKCGGDLFYSYRREGITGRCLASVGLLE